MTARKFSIVDFLINSGIITILVILAIVTDILQPTFPPVGNADNITLGMAPRFIIVCGTSGCLVIKGTNLSAGRMVGLSACIAGTSSQEPNYSGKLWESLPDFGIRWVLVVLLICIAICGIFGCIDGLVVSSLQVPAFIGTLGMQLIVYSVYLVYTDAALIGECRAAYTEAVGGRLFGVVPYLFIIALVVGIVMWFIYNKTPYGGYTYAIGGSEQAAEVSDVNTKRTKIVIYITTAAPYVLGGSLVGVKSGDSPVNMGRDWKLEAIAARTINGVSINGGIGRVPGVLIGALVFEALRTYLQYLSVDTNYQYVIQGTVTMVAIVLGIRKYIAKK